MSTRPEEKPNLKEASSPEIYRFLGTYYLHQDRQSWRRTETILAVEVAGLAGSFAQAPSWLNALSLIAATTVVIALALFIKRDLDIRDHIRGMLDTVNAPEHVRLAPEPTWVRGRNLLWFIIGFIVLANALLFLTAYTWSPAPWRGFDWFSEAQVNLTVPVR